MELGDNEVYRSLGPYRRQRVRLRIAAILAVLSLFSHETDPNLG